MTAKLGPEAQVIVWSKPGGLTFFGSFVAAGLLLELSISCRDASSLLNIVKFRLRETLCIAAVDYVSGIHVVSSDYWLASFFARLFKITNFAVKHSIMTPEMVSAPAEVEPENVVPEDTYLDLTEPDEVVATQSGKFKRKRLGEQSDTLPAKQLRKDHPSLTTGTGGKTLAGLRQLMPTSPLVLRPFFQADIQALICLESEVSSRAEHELELKEKLKGKYDARGRPLISSPCARNASCPPVQKLELDYRLELLRGFYPSTPRAFQDFKEKAEAQQEEQAQVLYNRVAELEAHVMDVSGRLEGEFYPTYLTTLAGRRCVSLTLGWVKHYFCGSSSSSGLLNEEDTDEAPEGIVVANPKFEACPFR
ncbi:hypothetical protein Tco_0843926 [Tanacetum coccineum]